MSADPDDFSQFEISEQEKDKLVAEVIRYILFKTENSSGCPIRREELTHLVTGKDYRQRNFPAFVINEAKNKLKSIFGYEMRELTRSRGGGSISQQSSGDAKSYIIVSDLSPDVYKKFVEDTNSSHLCGFSFVVLGIILLAGGKITEENLWHHLRRMEFRENDENHPIFGSTKQTLEALLQQKYLHKEKVNAPEGNTIYYELAERALDEQVHESIKDYVSKIVQNDANAQ